MSVEEEVKGGVDVVELDAFVTGGTGSDILLRFSFPTRILIMSFTSVMVAGPLIAVLGSD